MKPNLIMGEDEEQNIIEHYRLSSHPEGGWFRRTYSSSTNVFLDRGERLCGSSIYYFLKQGEHSCLHSLKSDEIWYFHFGSSVRIHLFSTSEYHSVDLGHDWQCGEVAQFPIPAGVVFGAELLQQKGALMSCSVCPGFAIDDFKWASIDEILVEFPEQAEIIRRLQPDFTPEGNL